MEGKMKVAVMNGIGEMGFVEREIPAHDQVQMAVLLHNLLLLRFHNNAYQSHRYLHTPVLLILHLM